MKYQFIILLVLLVTEATSQELRIQNPVRFLALGDSYTIGQGVQLDESWPKQLAGELKNKGIQIDKLDIIAETGWTTKRLLDEIQKENPTSDYNLVSLLIGVNNQYQGLGINEYPDDFRRLLEMALTFSGGRKSGVFVLSIPDYGYTPFGSYNQENISAEIDAYNTINEKIADEMGIAYFNVTPISREVISNPWLLASDSLHPSGIMYARWVKLIVAELKIADFSTHLFHPEEKEIVTVYPNPAGDYLVVNAPQNANEIVFYDARGVRLLAVHIDEDPIIRIDISKWDKGMYFYQFNSQNRRQISGKIVVE